MIYSSVSTSLQPSTHKLIHFPSTWDKLKIESRLSSSLQVFHYELKVESTKPIPRERRESLPTSIFRGLDFSNMYV
jgi:hypothetical protein